MTMQWEDCVNRDLEREGGEWRTTGKDRRRWRLVIEESEEREEDEEDDGKHGQPHPHNRDAKRRLTSVDSCQKSLPDGQCNTTCNMTVS